MILTREMHDAVKNSPVGQYIDRLIREAFERGDGMNLAGGGNVIQQLWLAFMEGGGYSAECDFDTPKSFREIKQEIKNGPSV